MFVRGRPDRRGRHGGPGGPCGRGRHGRRGVPWLGDRLRNLVVLRCTGGGKVRG